jgi:glycosyltransferase involved in cell wall biosynthesis
VARKRLEATYAIRERYVLFVGQLKTRSKNLLRLLEAFRQFRAEAGEPFRLVMVGRRNRTTVGLDEAVERLALKDHVVELGHVPDADLPLLYSGAEMLAFPSLCEGFGFPVIEAMACGTPVVTSKVSCLPEVAGGAALLVDPYSVEDIAAGMHRVFRDAALREDLCARGFERAKFFSWERTARQTLEAYERAASA